MPPTAETDEQPRITGDEVSAFRRPSPALLLISTRGAPQFRCLPLPPSGADFSLVLGRDHSLPELPDTSVSRKHATIAYSPSTKVWTITEHGARNGTFVDGREIHGTVSVETFRTLRLSHTLFVPVLDGARHSALPSDLRADADAPELARGAAMRALLSDVAAAAREGHAVLLLGPTGAGKEGLARHYHASSSRARGPFVAFNCANLDANNAEARLFGSQRGAYTGAVRAQTGVLREADGGVLFLDEVGELAIDLQAKLLRALETGEVLPLGASKAVRVDFHVVAATSRDLPRDVAARTFREDLWHRLASGVMRVPALRDRPEEIPFMLETFAEGQAMTSTFVEHCLLQPWLGNARELRNATLFAVRAAKGEPLTRAHVEGFEALVPEPPPKETRGAAARPTLDEATVRAAWGQAAGSMPVFGRLLGIGKTKAYELAEEYELRKRAT